MSTTSYIRIAVPALIGMVSLVGFGYYETIEAIAHSMSFDLPGAHIARPVLGTVGCLALAALVRRAAERVVAKAMARRGHRPPRLLYEMIAVLLFVAAFVAIFAFVFDRSLTGVLATSGVIVAVLGFALRNIIADVASGLALSLESPFRIGDWIETEAGVAGKVVEITWRATQLETRDQVHVVLPNSRIAAGRVTNYSAPKRHYRVQQTITLDPGVPVSRAKQVLLNGVSAASKIRRTPAPDVRVRGVGPQGVDYVVRYWVPSRTEEIDCRDAILESVDRHLRFAGLGIPHDRQDNAIHRSDDPTSTAYRPDAEVLHQIPLLDGLAPESLRSLTALMKRVILPAGATVANAGSHPQALFIVTEGLMSMPDKTGAEPTRTLGPGDAFIAASLHAVRDDAAEPLLTATTRVVVLKIPIDQLRLAFLNDQAFARLIRRATLPRGATGSERLTAPSVAGISERPRQSGLLPSR